LRGAEAYDYWPESLPGLAREFQPFTYGYNRRGALQTISYRSGRVISMGFDSAGRIANVTNAATGNAYASNVRYAPNNAVSSLTLGNNVTESTTFNTRLQPTQIQARHSGWFQPIWLADSHLHVWNWEQQWQHSFSDDQLV
jgi:hypothetical protein